MVEKAKPTSEQIDAAFKAANDYIKKSDPKNSTVSNTEKLQLYALFKQATVGVCTGPQPGRLQVVNRAKHDAWKALGSMGKDEAKLAFISILSKSDPKFAPKL